MGRWWILLTLPLLWTTVSSNADSYKESEPTTGRCCPCPEDLDTLSFPRSGQPEDLAGFASNAIHSVSGLNSCPCSSRDADSVGSPSLFFPSVLRAARPFTSSPTEKDGDVKPLLHPEVDLASSVLETLREVTDEEYRDALARDSARSVAKSLETGIADVSPIIPIAVITAEEAVPADDMISEGSHNHETRCLDSPLGRSISRSPVPFHSPDLLTDILKLPLRRSKSFKSLLDWDNGFEASNVNEQRVKVEPVNTETNRISNLDPFNLFSRNTEQPNNSDLPLPFSHRNGKKIIKPSFKDTREKVLPDIFDLLPKPDIRHVSLFGKSNARNENEDSKIDRMSAPSTVVNSFAEPNSARASDLLSSKVEISNNRRNSKKLNNFTHTLKTESNDLNQSQHGSKSKSRDAVSDLLNNVLKGLQNPNHLLPPNIFDINNMFLTTESPESEDKEAANQMLNTKDNSSGTQISDTAPSSTVIKEHAFSNGELECVVSDTNNKDNNDATNFVDEIKFNTKMFHNSMRPMKTKIITHVSSNDIDDQNSLEAVNDSENETEEDDDEEDHQQKTKQVLEDISMDQSNDFVKFSPFSAKSDNFPQYDNIDSEEINGEFNLPQSKSVKDTSDDSHAITRGDINHKHTNKILQNLGTIRIPEISKSSSTKPMKENPGSVGIDDLQKMSDTLLDKDKLRSIEINTEKPPSRLGDDCLLKPSQDNNGNNVEEMASEASENLFDIIGKSNRNILKSPLIPGIVEPGSLFDIGENSFSRPSNNLAEMLNNIPKLEIPNIFDSDNPLSSPKHSLMSNSQPFSRTLQPLEDINLDIFQLKPISTQSRAPISKIPSIHLNSYKTRLPLPKEFDLKPVILESARKTKDGGILDAILTLGKRKNDIIDSSNILKSSITLPGINDIGETLLENAHNLLSTPLETTGRNLIEDTLRSSQVLSENLKVQAKNAVNDIQQNIESSLKDAGISSRGTLGKSFTPNSNIFQDISIKHEELEDKLKGIHHDFSDRLETLRYNINEHLPNLDDITKKSNYNSLSESNIKKQRKHYSTKSPKSYTTGKHDSPRSSSYRNNHLNMIPSSSINRPSAVKKPLFELPLLQLPKSNQIIKANDPTFNLSQKPQDASPKKNNVKYNTKPFLTAKSNTKPIIDIKSKLQSKYLKDKFNPNNNARTALLESKTKQNGRQRTLPSEIRPKYADPIKTLNRSKSTALLPSKILPIVNIKPPVLRTPSKGSKELQFKGLFAPNASFLKKSLPVIDSSLLSNVREALAPTNFSKGGGRGMDMLKSASRNVEMINSDSMKEDTAYTCKMVCSKNRN